MGAQLEKTPDLCKTSYKTACFIGFLLSLIGGWCDGATFFLMNIFCGHVTGNTVLAVVYFFQQNWSVFFPTIGVLFFLSLGASIGILYEKKAAFKFSTFTGVLFVSALLFISFLIGEYSATHINVEVICAFCCAFALGVLNELAKRKIGPEFAASYITGSTISLLGLAVGRENKTSHKLPYALNLLGFFFGAVFGVGCAKHFGIHNYLFLAIPLSLILISLWIIESKE